VNVSIHIFIIAFAFFNYTFTITTMNTQDNNSLECPKLIGVCSTPKILWYQTDSIIIIRIILTDVKKICIEVNCDTFMFW
jgi:hypothetical protein